MEEKVRGWRKEGKQAKKITLDFRIANKINEEFGSDTWYTRRLLYNLMCQYEISSIIPVDHFTYIILMFVRCQQKNK